MSNPSLATPRVCLVAITKHGAAQAARLAVMLPSPKRFEKAPGSAYLAGRTRALLARMGRSELP